MIEGISKDKKRLGLTAFSLHVLAMFFMLLDHLGKTSFINSDVLTYVGRLAFPMFAFLIAEGFFYTKNLWKYIFRLLIFALISEIPFNLMISGNIYYPEHQNVLWTFLLALLCIKIFDKTKKMNIDFKFAFYPFILIFFFLLGLLFRVDYEGFGILTVLLFYFTKIKDNDAVTKKLVFNIIQLFGLYFINYNLGSKILVTFNLVGNNINFYVQSLSIFSLLFIWLYNGKHGFYNNIVKYTYYLFYPVHMIIIWLLKVLFC